MKTRQAPVLSVRKRPRQARSARLVTSILKAAVRVLEREGAQKFTTARVAEEAGVSVGSLYQYFPIRKPSCSGSRPTNGTRPARFWKASSSIRMSRRRTDCARWYAHFSSPNGKRLRCARHSEMPRRSIVTHRKHGSIKRLARAERLCL